MFVTFAFLLLWPFLIAATIEARKVHAAANGREAIDRLDKKLPKLPFTHGAASGLVLTPLFRALVIRLLLSDEPLLVDVSVPMVDAVSPEAITFVVTWAQWSMLSAFFGLGAGAVSGQAYKAVKESYIDGIRDKLDWWRGDKSNPEQGQK